jgi:hypothetical protein
MGIVALRRDREMTHLYFPRVTQPVALEVG